jgi:uncharacterized phage infection (PIP) family protein YhgE
MDPKVLSGVLAVALIGLLICGGVVYANLNTKLATLEMGLQNTEKERDSLTAKLAEREKDLAGAQERADLGDQELAKERERIRRLHAGIGVIGECLNGVLQSMSASSDGDEARSVLILLTVVDSCKTSEKIIEEVQAFQPDDGNAAPQNGSSAVYHY